MKQGVLALVVALFVVGAASAVADARPGGGGGGGGGGSHGTTYRPIYRSSQSGGSGGDPGAGAVIAVILGLGITTSLIYILSRRGERKTIQQVAAAPHALVWDALLAADPAFSRIEFDLRVRELYKTVQRVRHDTLELAKLEGAELSEAARAELAKNRNPVDAVQIDGVRIIEANATTITCAIDAVHLRGGGAFHVMSRWSFARRDGAWIVDRIAELASSGALNLVGMGSEVGNDLPTISDDDAISKFQELHDASGKTYGWTEFVEHVKKVFAQVTEAWNQQHPTLAQDLVTPEVTEYLELWLDEHSRQGLINHHDRTYVRHVGLAKVAREPAFDVVTVRVYGQGFDYTERVGGTETVGGSRVEPRMYTEYWTFVSPKNAGNFKLASIVQDELYAG